MRVARGLVFATLLQGISVLYSHAATWAWSGTGPIEGTTDVFRILRAGDGSLHAATGPDGAVFRTSGGGWSPPTFLPGAHQVFGLLESANGRLYSGTSPNGTIYRSEDRGESWTPVFQEQEGVSEIKSLAETRDGAIYAGTGPEGKAFVSRDGGDSWEETGTIAGAQFVYCLLAASDGSVYAGTNRGVFVTSGKEGRWDFTGGPLGIPFVLSLVEETDGTICAGCDGSVFEYGIGSGTWHLAGRVNPLAYAVFSIEDIFGTLFAGTGTDGGIHALSPGAVEWRRVTEVEGAPNVYDLLQAPDGIAYAAVGGSPGAGAVYAHAPLLGISVDDARPAPGDPLEISVAVRPVAARFDAYVVAAGPGGTYSCASNDSSALIPGILPCVRGVPGLAVPVSRVVLSFPAIPDSAPPGAWSVIAGIVPAGAPPSERNVIPGYLDSRIVEIRPARRRVTTENAGRDGVHGSPNAQSPTQHANSARTGHTSGAVSRCGIYTLHVRTIRGPKRY